MDWWFDTEMPKPTRAERQATAAQERTERDASIEPLCKRDGEEILAQIAALKKDLAPTPTPSAIVVRWWSGPLGSAVIGGLSGAVIGGLIVGFIMYKIQTSNDHAAKDLATQIADVITLQLNQRTASDAENRRNQITVEVGKELTPFHQQLEVLSQDIGKIKDRLHIAKNALPADVPQDLKRFAPMNSEKFAASLPALNAELREATLKQVTPDKDTLNTLAEKLRHTPETAPEYWQTVLRFIQLLSSGVKDVPPESQASFTWRNNTGFISLGNVSHEVILLDGGDLGPTHFDHCRIIFTKHPVRMRAVEFINCAFDIPDTLSPGDYLKDAARELLASNLTKITAT